MNKPHIDIDALFPWERLTVPVEDMTQGPLPERYGRWVFYILSLVLCALCFCFLSKSLWLTVPLSLLIARLITVDLSHMILPDIYVGALGVCALAILFIKPQITWHSAGLGFLLGLLVPLGIVALLALLKKASFIGGGDIKLMAVSGLFVGAELFFIYLSIASILSLIITLLPRTEKHVPFGPGLAFSLWICYLWQSKVFTLFM